MTQYCGRTHGNAITPFFACNLRGEAHYYEGNGVLVGGAEAVGCETDFPNVGLSRAECSVV